MSGRLINVSLLINVNVVMNVSESLNIADPTNLECLLSRQDPSCGCLVLTSLVRF